MSLRGARGTTLQVLQLPKCLLLLAATFHARPHRGSASGAIVHKLVADLTHVHAEVPARTAVNILTEVRAVRQAVFGQVKRNQLLETPVLLLGAVDHQRKVPAFDVRPPLGLVSHLRGHTASL
jgi:hypothetical protein